MSRTEPMETRNIPKTMRERREIWAASALLEEVTQANGTLKSDQTPSCFCFTGLACEIYRRIEQAGTWIPKDVRVSSGYYVGQGYIFLLNGEENPSVMPKPVQDFYGLSSYTGSYNWISPSGDLRGSSLIQDNDHGHDFLYLAQVLRLEPVGLITRAAEREIVETNQPLANPKAFTDYIYAEKDHEE